jgi:tetraacyldisaccharide 4'-kinase
MLHLFRKLLFPFSIIYGGITALRNTLYNFGVFKAYSPPIPTIVVGNLSVGGTGKTPHIELLFQLLQPSYKIAILSRGYGRKTKGYLNVTLTSLASEVGDEPMQYKQKFKESAVVAVCENRKHGILNILKSFPETEVILLDDAFQHRAVLGGFQVLLSEFKRPFFKDCVLPAGNLREFQEGKKRADLCIYTKSPETITTKEKMFYTQKFDFEKPVFFSRIAYLSPIPLTQTHREEPYNRIILVTGIANPTPLIEHCKKFGEVISIPFPDHHDFSAKDIDKIHEIFGNFADGKTQIVTTEKDAMRLNTPLFRNLIAKHPWYMLPISIEIEESKQFEKEILDYVEKNKRSSSLHSIENVD